MMKKLMSVFLALTMAFGTFAATSSDAEAGRRGGRLAVGVAAGIIGLGILGAAANARGRHHGSYHSRYDEGPECYSRERCGYGQRKCWYNNWGDYVCRKGEYRCWREEVCD